MPAGQEQIAKEELGINTDERSIDRTELYQADEATLKWTAERLRALGVRQLLAAHCTGMEATYRLRADIGMTRESAVVAGVGSSYTLGSGISTLSLAR